MKRIVLSLLVFCLTVVNGTVAFAFTPLEEQGREIYRNVVSPYGNNITAYVGQASVALPATSIPCIGCHGRDGVGLPEGGLTPSNITWRNLSKSYGGESASGRRFPAYSEKSLYIALTRGLDPAGNRLDPGMPRFDVSMKEVRALIAYLKRIEEESDPGIFEDRVAVGTLQPDNNLGQVVTAVLKACFDDVNREGGVFGRKLELQVNKLKTGDALLQEGERLFDSDTVFAAISTFTAGQDRGFNQLAQRYRIPNIGPFTQTPATDEMANKYTFYLFGGESEKIQSLLQFARVHLQTRLNEIGIVYTDTGKSAQRKESQFANAQPVKVKAKANSESKPPEYVVSDTISTDMVELMKQDGVQAVVFSGADDQVQQLARLLDQANWYPAILLPRLSILPALKNTSAAFREHVYFASSMLSSGHSREGMNSFLQFHQRHNLSRNYIAAQVAAYTAVTVLVEGLKRSGKQLTRENYIAALEAIQNLETGMVPPLSFGINRRLGESGAYVLMIDSQTGQLKPAAAWQRLDL
ncbi:cytochrome c/ABC transporter substrate-binding protein [Kaarinaea lacus]